MTGRSSMSLARRKRNEAACQRMVAWISLSNFVWLVRDFCGNWRAHFEFHLVALRKSAANAQVLHNPELDVCYSFSLCWKIEMDFIFSQVTRLRMPKQWYLCKEGQAENKKRQRRRLLVFSELSSHPSAGS
jgi:hypothetical protein